MPPAADGPSGVHSVFDIVRADVDSTLLNLGRPSVDDLTAADVFLAEDFSHGLNAPTAFPGMLA
jgi:isopentenyl diphosphate isomerase/L-lactate dehydrogenase-like FMN-dependent dehydrogenase